MTTNPSKDEHQLKLGIFSWNLIVSILTLTIAITAILFLHPAPQKSDGTIVILPEFKSINSSDSIEENAITRKARPHTTNAPTDKYEVIEYTIQSGDTIFSVAEKFGLEPETILWANLESLSGNHIRNLHLDLIINILPVDGVYVKFEESMSLAHLADTFDVSVEDIVYFPGNHLEVNFLDPEETEVEIGAWLVIPGGTREIETQSWRFPITHRTPPPATYYGSDSCDAVNDSSIGDGSFIWPTAATYVSGYNWAPPIHPAIDIGGSEGDSIYAADNGVIVVAGWSEYGYGNMVVIDHGNGWQTAYAHMLIIAVECGDAVSRGDKIGELGRTGNSTGPHLHFEMKFNGTNYNPFDYVSP